MSAALADEIVIPWPADDQDQPAELRLVTPLPEAEALGQEPTPLHDQIWAQVVAASNYKEQTRSTATLDELYYALAALAQLQALGRDLTDRSLPMILATIRWLFGQSITPTPSIVADAAIAQPVVVTWLLKLGHPCTPDRLTKTLVALGELLRRGEKVEIKSLGEMLLLLDAMPRLSTTSVRCALERVALARSEPTLC